MGSYIFKRLIISLLVLFLVSLFVFFILHMLPGDPVLIMLGEGASEEKVVEMRSLLHLDKPLVVQYFIWISGIFHGDFGTSVNYYGMDIGELIRQKLPVTLSITIPSLLISIVLGVIAGTVTAVNRGTILDQSVTILSTTGIGIPVFWVSIFCIWIFGVNLKLLPISGYISPSVDLGQHIMKAIMPVFCGMLSFLATFTRQTRSNMLEVINQDYVRTARADGIPESRVIYGHALKNASIPLITIVSLSFRMLVGGSVMIEKVFNIPGIGQFALTSLLKRDYPCVQAVTLITAIVTIIGNLLADIIYGIVDPRIRQRWSK